MSTEDTPPVRGRRFRSLWTVVAGVLAAAGLAGALFTGVANAEEASTGDDGAAQDQTEPTPEARRSEH